MAGVLQVSEEGPGLGLQMLAHLYGWREACWLSHLDHTSPEEIRDVQAAKLRRLLVHAAESVPYYREVFADCGIDPATCEPISALRHLPVLTKSDIEANFPDRILAGGRRGFAAKHLMTSGTTSDRIEIVLSLGAQHWRHALQLWSDRVGGRCWPGRRRLEIPPDACSRVCGEKASRPDGLLAEIRWEAARSQKPGRAVVATVARRAREAVRSRILKDTTLPPLIGPQGTASVTATVAAHVERIAREDPWVLTALPVYLREIAKYAEHSGVVLDVPVIRTMGGLCTPAMKREIAAGLNAEVFETYGSNELGPIACECEAHRGLHVAAGCYVVEILRDGSPVEAGEVGSIAVTCLHNYAMPLIRYELGDIGRRVDGPCECGRTTPMIECNGRLQGLVVTPTGREVTEEEITELAHSDLGLEHFQLIEHRPGEFDLLFVGDESDAPDVGQIRRAFAALLDGAERIEVFPVDTIYPESTGKFRFVKSASYEDFARDSVKSALDATQ